MPTSIRPLRPADRAAIDRILHSTGNFTDAEIAIALELVDAAIATGDASGYHCLVLDTDDDGAASTVLGYACYGPTPLTDGTFDLYWIAVDRAAQGRGHGAALLDAVERTLRAAHGRLLLIETSSQESYGPTIRFYGRHGYALAARLADFYHPGDDKLVYVKRL